MSLVQYPNGTEPSQEWSVIQHTRRKIYDDSKNNAVMYILEEAATDVSRKDWEDRYPGRDRATIPQLLGSYCYEPPRDIPQSYWSSAMNELDLVEEAQADKCARSEWPEWVKEEYYDDLWFLRTRREEWYDEMEKDVKPQLLLEGTKDKVPTSEPAQEWSDPRHNSRPGTNLNMWERRVKERIEQGTYKYMSDEGEGSSQT
jgi:hypothetical protein